MRKFRFSTASLTILVGVLAALSGCRTMELWPPADPEAIAAGRELLAVFETGDPTRFEDYLRSRTDFDVSLWFDAEARKLIYDGESLRRFRPRLRSIMDIIALGEIEILGSWPVEGSVILSFVPRRYLRDAERPEFFTDEWMRKYFACWFKKVDGRWQLAWNICFGETGGPYPVDMAGPTEEQEPGLSVAVRR